jgi:hypothetical protein
MKPVSGPTVTSLRRRSSIWLLFPVLCLCVSGCAVVAVADAGVTVVATAVKVGATAVGAAADVAGAGVRAVTGGGSK